VITVGANRNRMSTFFSLLDIIPPWLFIQSIGKVRLVTALLFEIGDRLMLPKTN
jgi:hypothetical protein